MGMQTQYSLFTLFMNKQILNIAACIISVAFGGCGTEGNGMSKGAQTDIVGKILTPKLPPANFKFNSIASYIEWYMSLASGNKVIQEQNSCVYEMSYKPELVLAFDALTPGMKIDNAFINRANILTKDSGNIVFHLKLSGSLDHATFRTNKSMQEYFGYEAENDFNLIVGKDTLAPVVLHYENTYPQLPYLSVLLSFKRIHAVNDVQQIVFSGTMQEPIVWQFHPNTLFYQPKFTKINELWR